MNDTHELESARDVTARAMAYLKHRAAFPITVREGDFLVLIDREPDGTQRERYDVPVADLHTAGGVAFWVRQLAPKSWVTTKHLEQLAQAVIDLNPGSCPH